MSTTRKAILVAVMGLVALIPQKNAQAFEEDESPDEQAFSACAWCGNSCPGDVISFCTSRCSTAGTGSGCTVSSCTGINNRSYTYRINCL